MLIYSGGDMLKKGSQLLKEAEKKQLESIGFEVYSPQDDKEINDKTNQTAESNDALAEKIFAKDTTGIITSDILIFEVDNNNVGTSVEIGQSAQHELEYALRNYPIKDVHELIRNPARAQMFEKKYFFHSYDIRRTDIPETGDRRSWSINQYLYGAVSLLSPQGILSWDEIIQEIQKLRK